MAMARSLGANPELFRVKTLFAAGEWHRQLELGAMGRWVPLDCPRAGAEIKTERFHDGPPASGPVCSACWPVWPAEGRR